MKWGRIRVNKPSDNTSGETPHRVFFSSPLCKHNKTRQSSLLSGANLSAVWRYYPPSTFFVSRQTSTLAPLWAIGHFIRFWRKRENVTFVWGCATQGFCLFVTQRLQWERLVIPLFAHSDCMFDMLTKNIDHPRRLCGERPSITVWHTLSHARARAHSHTQASKCIGTLKAEYISKESEV